MAQHRVSASKLIQAPAIPCRVEWVEHVVGQQLKLGVKEVRRLAWRNLATIIRETGTMELLPQPFATLLAEVSPDAVP